VPRGAEAVDDERDGVGVHAAEVAEFIGRGLGTLTKAARSTPAGSQSSNTHEISNSRRMALPKPVVRRLHKLRHLRAERSESTSPDFVRGQAPMTEGEHVCAADKTNSNIPHDQHQQPNDGAGL